MRVYHYVLLASCVCMMSAQAATIVAELPESQSVSQTATMARTSGQQLLDKVKGLQNGIYAGGNNNSVGNWTVNGEGTWVNQDDVGSITLCGRSGVAGSSFAMVLGGPQEGDSVSSITFSCNTPSSVISSYSMVLAVYDSTGTLVEELSKIQDFSFTSTSETTTISLDMSAAPLTWEEGYKVVAGVRGGAEALLPLIQLQVYRFPMKRFPSLPQRLWACWAWELCCCAADVHSKYPRYSGGS